MKANPRILCWLRKCWDPEISKSLTAMTRLVVTSDTHLGITSMPRIAELVKSIEREKPDAVAIAGDVGEGRENFGLVLDEFRHLEVPIALVAGNHDVWNHDKQSPSRLMYESILPGITESAGAVWLETKNMVVGKSALVGSIAWYDYSALDSAWKTSPEECWRRKKEFDADAWMVDWEWNDLEFCRIIQPGFEEHLKTAQSDEQIENIVLITHSPIFDPQITRKSNNPAWAFSNAYYGNLTFGNIALRFPKVTHAIAGHTHAGRDKVIELEDRKIHAVTLNSQYNDPVYIVIELS
jgi:hypothetical protein